MSERPRIIIVKGSNVITSEQGQPIGAIVSGDASLDYAMETGQVEVILEQKIPNMQASSPALLDPAGNQAVSSSDQPNQGKNGTLNYGY